jgi:3-mercaptopyruvate sulfurtransferase SseA
VNRFFKDNLTPDGRFKSAGELKADFAPLFDSAPRAIMQCGSGVTACHNLLALEVAGLPGPRCIRARGANGGGSDAPGSDRQLRPEIA